MKYNGKATLLMCVYHMLQYQNDENVHREVNEERLRTRKEHNKFKKRGTT